MSNHTVVAFSAGDTESSAYLQAVEACDGEALYEIGLDVRLCDAEIKNNEIWVPVRNAKDLDHVQEFFNKKLRKVTRKELFANVNNC